MKRLIFTDQAEADLEAIGDYIAIRSPLRAVTFIQELRRDCVGCAPCRSGIRSLSGIDH